MFGFVKMKVSVTIEMKKKTDIDDFWKTGNFNGVCISFNFTPWMLIMTHMAPIEPI